MSSITRPGELTESPLPFASDGVCEAYYRPRAGALVAAFVVEATRAGDVTIHLRRCDNPSSIGTISASAVSVTANTPSLVSQVNAPLGEIGNFELVVRYTNTSHQSGTCRFWASDDGGRR